MNKIANLNNLKSVSLTLGEQVIKKLNDLIKNEEDSNKAIIFRGEEKFQNDIYQLQIIIKNIEKTSDVFSYTIILKPFGDKHILLTGRYSEQNKSSTNNLGLLRNDQTEYQEMVNKICEDFIYKVKH
jgi:hypothetical protein